MASYTVLSRLACHKDKVTEMGVTPNQIIISANMCATPGVRNIRQIYLANPAIQKNFRHINDFISKLKKNLHFNNLVTFFHRNTELYCS
jgi:hypothetical protein